MWYRPTTIQVSDAYEYSLAEKTPNDTWTVHFTRESGVKWNSPYFKEWLFCALLFE